jgi:hypothetical protein
MLSRDLARLAAEGNEAALDYFRSDAFTADLFSKWYSAQPADPVQLFGADPFQAFMKQMVEMGTPQM